MPCAAGWWTRSAIPLDGKGPIEASDRFPVETHRARRASIASLSASRLQTGLKADRLDDSDRHAASANSSSAIARRARAPSPSTPSSIRRRPASSASTSPIGQKRSTIARFIKTLEDLRRDGKLHHCVRRLVRSGHHAVPGTLTPAAPWASTSATTASTALIIYDDLSEARGGLPRDVAAAAASAGPGSLSGRRLSIFTAGCWKELRS